MTLCVCSPCVGFFCSAWLCRFKNLDCICKHTEFPTRQLIGTPERVHHQNRHRVQRQRSRMSDDDTMMAIDDEEIAPSRNKGKGKAVDTVEMDDNLPW